MHAKLSLFAASMLFPLTQAVAAEIVISLPNDTKVERISATYDCSGTPVDVEYINAGSISLAVIGLDEETIVASNVIAGSGAKYAGAQYVWWSKGDEASLFDLTKGEDAQPVNCTSAS